MAEWKDSGIRLPDKLRDIDSDRYYITMDVYDGYIYVMGSLINNINFFRCNIATKQWQELPNPNLTITGSKWGLDFRVSNGYLVFILNLAGYNTVSWHYIGKLKLSDMSWYVTENYAVSADTSLAIDPDDGNIYLSGGRDIYYQTSNGFTGDYLNNIYIGNVSSYNFSSFSNLSRYLNGASSATKDNNLYVFGGLSPRSGQSGVSETLQSYEAVNLNTGSSNRYTLPAIIAGESSSARTYNNLIYISSNRNIVTFDGDTFTTIANASQGTSNTYFGIDSENIYIQGPNSNNTIWVFSLATATISNPTPAAGFLDDNIDNTLSWIFNSNPEGIAQKSAVVQWRNATNGVTGTTNTINVSGSNQYVTIPAGTLPNGAFQWRVNATGTNDVETGFTEWFTISTIEELHLAPTLLTPNGGKYDITKDIQFSWSTNKQTSADQKAFEIGVGESATNLATIYGKVYSPDSNFIAPAGTLPTTSTGTIYWNVRTYNSDDQAGPWSQVVSFVGLSSPNPPKIIGVTTDNSRPTVTWSASSQVAFQLQFRQGDAVVYDSGETLGNNLSYRVKDFLQNGQYNVYVRYKNELQLWSGWSEAYPARINPSRFVSVTASGYSTNTAAVIKFHVGGR